ncbi:hypothetical protein BC936DRAFT_146988 [Jimgerdemannia flammicorona]|uniref:Uncharacterized protein n=1 Tax=Jimgerdemannia flammicorona TaxID=994334 RepID=A0A433D6E0_9FUNG|nr:hypothetical protein BC936DRAFT_146988 [Jimgerdemannia flammicorona]
MVGIDNRDPYSINFRGKFPKDYTKGWSRNGVSRDTYFDIAPENQLPTLNNHIRTARKLGAIIIGERPCHGVWQIVNCIHDIALVRLSENADIPTIPANQSQISFAENYVLNNDLKYDMNKFLADLVSTPVKILADIVSIIDTHPEEATLDGQFFGQGL